MKETFSLKCILCKVEIAKGQHIVSTKKFQKKRKNCKKGIDKGKKMWYNIKAASKRGCEMVLEN